MICCRYEQSLPHNIKPLRNHGGCKDLHMFGTIQWGGFILIGITIIYSQNDIPIQTQKITITYSMAIWGP